MTARTTVTLAGPVLSRTGFAQQDQHMHDRRDRRYTITHVLDVTLAGRQPGDLRVRLRHDPNIVLGRVVHLERLRSGAVWAVATIDPTLPNGCQLDLTTPWYWSAGLTTAASRDPLADYHRVEGATIREVSITETPAARVAPITVHRSDVTKVAGGYPLGIDPVARDVLDHAHAAATSARFDRAAPDYFDLDPQPVQRANEERDDPGHVRFSAPTGSVVGWR